MRAALCLAPMCVTDCSKGRRNISFARVVCGFFGVFFVSHINYHWLPLHSHHLGQNYRFKSDQSQGVRIYSVLWQSPEIMRKIELATVNSFILQEAEYKLKNVFVRYHVKIGENGGKT